MPEPITLITLATLAAAGTGISAYAGQKSADEQVKAQERISAGNLQLGQDRLSQEDKHFRQKRELALQQEAKGGTGNAMSILGGLGNLKRQQF